MEISCHSSNPDKGVNAVYHMMAVIEEIRRIIPNEHPILGKGILELTDIISSPYPGASVVGLCRATFDRRTLTGENEAVILGQVEAIARARKLRLEGADLSGRGGRRSAGPGLSPRSIVFPAWLIDEDNEYVQKALAGLKKAGIEAPISLLFLHKRQPLLWRGRDPALATAPALESLAHVRMNTVKLSS